MRKPNCDCTDKLIKKIREMNKLDDAAIIYFREQNLLNGSLISVISIEEKVTTKKGKVRTKNSHVNIGHSYCPFCGVAYATTADDKKGNDDA